MWSAIGRELARQLLWAALIRVESCLRSAIGLGLGLGLGLGPGTTPARAAPAEDGAQREPSPPHPDPAPRSPDRIFPELQSPSLSHESQVGISVLPGSGFRVLFPYSERIFCGQGGKRVCTSRLPAFIDVQPSYGMSVHWDLLLDMRFGLEPDFARTHQVAFAPGFRYWVEPGQRAKLFGTLQVVYDATEQHTRALSKSDVALHNTNGLMIEVMRDLGFYAQFGDTIGFVRWLRFEIDLGVGVQARFP